MIGKAISIALITLASCGTPTRHTADQPLGIAVQRRIETWCHLPHDSHPLTERQLMIRCWANRTKGH